MNGSICVLVLMLSASGLVLVWTVVDHRRYVAGSVEEVPDETLPLPVGRWFQ